MRRIDGLVKERRNSIANALELRHSCTNPTIYADMDILIIRLHLTMWLLNRIMTLLEELTGLHPEAVK